MLELDGSDAGGQFVRTALALAAITHTPIRLSGIRGGRDTPGLRPQHLAAVRVVAAICDADVEGDAVGATDLSFDPGTPRPGAYAADIGTAGSLTLLFDAVLPLAMAIDAPIRVTARGGTDVQWAPTLAYYRAVKLALLRRLGIVAAVDRGRTGFYPDGSGEATLTIGPSRLDDIDLERRGDPTGARVYSACSADLADRDVAARQATAAADRLRDGGVDAIERHVAAVRSPSTGSVVCVRLAFTTGVAGFDALGERGTPAEAVGGAAADDAVTFLDGPGAVDRHLADQLLPFLAIAGGRVAIPAVTGHVATTRGLLARFDHHVSVEDGDGGPVLRGP